MKKRRQKKVRIKSFSSVLLSILLVTSLIPSAIVILTATSQPVAAVNSYQIPNVPDLGQHSQCWCWTASAANAIYWYSQHGYLQLLDNRLNLTENDNTYNQLIGPHPTPPAPADNVHRLLHEIAIDCLYPGVPEAGENVYTFPASTWGFPISNLPYFMGLQEFINEQGASLTVREILDNTQMPAPYPGKDDINVFYSPPTLDNYEKEISENHPVLLWLNFIHTSPYYEEMDHVVTGVGYYDGGPGSQTITVADPWTAGNPDHNNNYASMVYDTLTVTNSAPLTVYYPAGSASPVQVIGLISISPTVPPAPVENYKMENMPDLGQHCENWCWTASAANVFKWYYHNGYPKLVDDPNSVGIDNSYLQWLQTPPSDPLHDNVLRLLHEIAKDCLYPNVLYENLENENLLVPWPITFCNPIDDNRFFYGLQKFIGEQGGQFKVREILDNNYFRNVHQGLPPENIPPANDNVVVYEQPTFDNYKSLLKAGGVLLQLDFRNYNYETGNLEALDHIVTGVSYWDNGPGQQWMQVSDSWTPLPGPDHNNLENLYNYDILTVTCTDPLWVVYTGYTPSGPMTIPVQVVKLISISPSASWTGTATFALENLYKVSVNKNLQLNTGSKLVVKFYDYTSAFESEAVIDTFTPPHSIVQNENVPHPAGGSLPVRTAVKKAELDLTTDDTSNIIATIASWTTHQSDLRTRYGNILRGWASSPLISEIGDILRQWGSAPT
jgi:hypothetical protein